MAKSFMFPAGAEKIINVDAPTLRSNLEKTQEEAMVRVRFSANPNHYRTFTRVEIIGPSTLAPNFQDPIPGTDGRGICYVTTKSMVIGYY